MRTSTGDKLGHHFFERPAIELARDLIGKTLVRRRRGREYRARIVETEAYVGPHDLASHSSKGRTRRTEVMFGPAGHAYVYFIYGMHDMFNIVASKPDDAQAVLVRAAEPVDGRDVDLSGPGKLARGMFISRDLNGASLTGDVIFLTDGAGPGPRIIVGPRIGVDYAGEWKDQPLRFMDRNSRAVSKPWPVEMKAALRLRSTSESVG